MNLPWWWKNEVTGVEQEDLALPVELHLLHMEDDPQSLVEPVDERSVPPP